MQKPFDDKARGGQPLPSRSEHNMAAWNRARQFSDRAARNRAAEATLTDAPAAGASTGARRDTGPGSREG